MHIALKLLATCAATLSLAGCVGVNVGSHVAAKDYTGQPNRIFVLNAVDDSFSKAAVDSFATSIQADLARCNVIAAVYRPDAMRLNAEADLRQSLQAFRPDAVLTMRQSVRSSMDGEVRGGTYIMTLHDMPTHRDVWKATVGLSASSRIFADRTRAGTGLSRKMVKQMSVDGVLKSCPAFTDEAA